MFYGKYIDAVTHAVQVVFLVAVPISFLAFLLSFLLPEVELRKTVQTVDMGEVQGAPQSRSSLQEIQLALERVSARENRAELYRRWPSGPASTCRRVRAGCSTGWPTSPRQVTEVAERLEGRRRTSSNRVSTGWSPPA